MATDQRTCPTENSVEMRMEIGRMKKAKAERKDKAKLGGIGRVGKISTNLQQISSNSENTATPGSR